MIAAGQIRSQAQIPRTLAVTVSVTWRGHVVPGWYPAKESMPSSSFNSPCVSPPAAVTSAAATPTYPSHTAPNCRTPTRSRPRDCPSRRNAAAPICANPMISAMVSPIPKVYGYTEPIGPPADRSGVVAASTPRKAVLSTHRPDDQEATIAEVQASPTASEAASPSHSSGLRVNQGARSGVIAAPGSQPRARRSSLATPTAPARARLLRRSSIALRPTSCVGSQRTQRWRSWSWSR